MRGLVRKLARAKGEKFYEGNVCKHCGTSQRYVCNYACVVCDNRTSREVHARKTPEERRAGHAAWRAKNADYCNLRIRAWRERRAEQLNQPSEV